MPYYLWQAVLAETPKIEISKEEHDAILAAWNAAYAVVGIEEEWEILIRNYLDLEMELLEAAMHSMVLSDESYHEMHQLRLEFARRLSNLLHSCRAYLDRTAHHLGSLPDGKTLQVAFKNVTIKCHSEQFAYRFMDVLRNFAQHRGFPLHGTTFDSAWTGEPVDGKKTGNLRYSVLGHVRINELLADAKLKAEIRSELEGVDELDVATLAREHLEALSSIHNELRTMLREPLVEWKRIVRSAISQYSEANKGDVIALAIGEFASDGKPLSQVHIFDDMLQRQERLARRNRELVNLKRRFVSNEIPKPKMAT